MTSCCENNLLLNQKDALERLANTIENMPENDCILEFPITKIDDVKKIRVILRKSKDDYNFVVLFVGVKIKPIMHFQEQLCKYTRSETCLSLITSFIYKNNPVYTQQIQ